MSNNLPWDLIISKLNNTFSTEEEEIRFQKWLEIDNNYCLFQELEKLWTSVQAKVSGYNPDVEHYWKELQNRIHKADSQEKPVKKPSLRMRIFNPRLYKIAAVAGLFLAISGAAYYFFSGDGGLQSEEIVQTYSAITGKSKIILPDGTEVWLHSNTKLEYKSQHSDVREVELEGEAYFKVKHDKKPFIVTTNDMAIKVHGTQFNVNSYSANDNAVVSLYEGSVSMRSLEDNSEDFFLKPGEEGHFNKKDKTINVEKGDVEFAKMWTSEKIKFENKNLHEVCRYLAKWYSVNIVIDPSIPDDQSYTFTLQNQSLEEVIRIMSNISSIDFYYTENNTLMIIP